MNLINLNAKIELNVPKEYWPIWKYRATLGHKVNHSFQRHNTMYAFAQHPRFGFIRSVVATKKIRVGEELLVNYGNYCLHNPDTPKWYIDAYVRELGPLNK